MGRKRFTAEQIIYKLRQTEAEFVELYARRSRTGSSTLDAQLVAVTRSLVRTSGKPLLSDIRAREKISVAT